MIDILIIKLLSMFTKINKKKKKMTTVAHYFILYSGRLIQVVSQIITSITIRMKVEKSKRTSVIYRGTNIIYYDNHHGCRALFLFLFIRFILLAYYTLCAKDDFSSRGPVSGSRRTRFCIYIYSII